MPGEQASSKIPAGNDSAWILGIPIKSIHTFRTSMLNPEIIQVRFFL
jgi:hypothetical protein